MSSWRLKVNRGAPRTSVHDYECGRTDRHADRPVSALVTSAVFGIRCFQSVNDNVFTRLSQIGGVGRRRPDWRESAVVVGMKRDGLRERRRSSSSRWRSNTAWRGSEAVVGAWLYLRLQRSSRFSEILSPPMFVSDLRHFLDIPEDAPGPTRKMAEHLGSIVRAATATKTSSAWETALPCRRRPGNRPARVTLSCSGQMCPPLSTGGAGHATTRASSAAGKVRISTCGGPVPSGLTPQRARFE